MHEIELIASAIATQEGWFASIPDAPKADNNPGDLRAAPNSIARPKDLQGFVKFSSPQEGIATLYWEVLYYALRGFTLRGMIEAWCPRTGADGGNNTDLYLANMAKWTGLDLDKRLWDYLPLSNAYLGLEGGV